MLNATRTKDMVDLVTHKTPGYGYFISRKDTNVDIFGQTIRLKVVDKSCYHNMILRPRHSLDQLRCFVCQLLEDACGSEYNGIML